ncbi:glutathione S-transferase N-terminal domain-containing protein [Porticoccus sp.]|nr:glutathione S-transferase N-terminal domain-containing protein [Porticoccus sp.]
MILYDCDIAPNPRRARMFIAEKGLNIEKIEVDIIGGENLTESFLSINPRGLLPVLELDDGTKIDEVMAICRYLEEIYPENPLLGSTPLEKARVEGYQRKMEFDGMIAVSEAFRNNVENERFSYRSLPGRDGTSAIEGLVERGLNTLDNFYIWLERYLTENEFVAGNNFTMADITAFVAVDFSKWVKRKIPKENTKTLEWYNKVSSRGSAKA